MFCRRHRDQQHTARYPDIEVRICYPFHPRFGETVLIVGRQRQSGMEHLTILQPDKTVCLIPAWMTKAAAASASLTDTPALSLESLLAVRVFVDGLLNSAHGESAPLNGGAHDTA